MALIYGMLCEGDSDLYTLEIVCARLANEHGFEIELLHEVSTPVSGPITKVNIKTKTRQFLAKGLDFGTYFADYDKGNQDKSLLIRENITAVNESWFDVSAVGIPSPHLEEWLICDENFIKSYLGLDSTKPLPHPKMAPKDRLRAIVSENGPDELTIGEFRRLVASGMNLDLVLNKSTTFARFSKNLATVLNSASR